ncbi:MAG: hypothetical protein M3P23_07295 [Actinomycetota bacterium]|nr:hypothetical protein [Actinomycetota bacterium]
MPDEWWMHQPAEHEPDDSNDSLDLGNDHWQPYSGVVIDDVTAPVSLDEPHPEPQAPPGPPSQAPPSQAPDELSAIDWVRLTGQPPPAAAADPTLSPSELLAELEARSADPLVRDLVERLRETYG